MASPSIRKSNRIKKRKKSHFQDDNFVYDDDEGDNFNLDVSQNISNLLDMHSKEKVDTRSIPVSKSFPNVSKNICLEQIVDDEDDQGGTILPSETSQQLPQTKNKKARKDLSCEVCDKAFTDVAALRRHLRVHTGERPFKCGLCDKSFTEGCSLKRHLKTHEEERPFTCDFCYKSFRDSTSFNRHQLTHVERPRSFQCSTCDKNFTDKSGLKRHERTHSGFRPFECPVCLKSFSESGSFRRHQKIHVGVRNYHCPRCKRSFMEKQSLVRHQKTVCGFWEAQDNDDNSLSQQDNSTTESNLQSEHEAFSSTDASARSHILPAIDTSDICSSVKSGDLVATLLNSTPTSSQKNSSHVSTPQSSKLERNSVKTSPSLGSLIQKDPNLYDSISEIVQSIDSYEKMLDLCGDSGQREIEAALTRNPPSLPDGLVCFECGELLVDGENFNSEGQSFNSKTYNSLRCLMCDDDVEKYGEPPVLTTEEDEQEGPMSGIGQREEKSESMCDDGVDYNSTELQNDTETVNGIQQFQKHYVDNVSGKYSDDQNDHIHHNREKSNNNALPSSRDDFDYNGDLQSYENSENVEIMPELHPENGNEVSQNSSTSIDYEMDDPNIPSVFPCHLCTKVFATSSFLDLHLELHRKSPHKCMVCNKSFAGKPALKHHMHVHTGEKPYSCPFCNKKFRDPSNFCKHKKFCSAANGSVPSPVGSASSAYSGASSVSLEECSVPGNKNIIEDEHHRLAGDNRPSSQLPNQADLYVVKQINVESKETAAQPVMVVTAPIDDFEEHPNENDSDEKKIEKEYIPCEICQKLCESPQHLDMHMNYHNGNPDVTCIECGKSFSDCHGLKRHMRIHAESRPFTCEYCSRGYCDNWSLKKHKSRGCVTSELQVPADFLHPCSRCSRVFSEVDFLEEHMKVHKGSLKFECDICFKKFSEAFNLKRHRRLHMSICPGCGEEFKNVSEMTDHQKKCSVSTPSKLANESGNNFSCPECGRSYSTLAYLERHRKFHSNSKVYECEICNKKFAEAFKLRRHKQVHSEDKPFICQDCGKGFPNKAHLKRHTTNSSCTISKTMRGAATFLCQYCDKVFSKNYMLVRHMNVHSQERPFSCDVCGRSYKDTSSLKRHQLTHLGAKDFVCSVCGKAFYYADSLKRHASGRCGKRSKSRKFRSTRARKKDGIPDSINNNNDNKNHRSSGNHEHLNSNNGGNEERGLSLGDANKMDSLHTLPYICKTFKSVPKIVNRRSKKVPSGPWSCHNKDHCWRCDSKIPSTESTSSSGLLSSHIAATHQHRKKKFYCPQCFVRFSRKVYWRAHMSLCTPSVRISKFKERLNNPLPILSDGTCVSGQRPRRSIPRTRWSWLNQIN